MELSTDQKGAIAESAIVHAAIKLGIGVYRPLSHGERYDLILDVRSNLLRVQCKWAYQKGDVIGIRAYSCRRSRDGLLRRAYNPSEVDAFAAYCLPLDRCYWFPMEWLRGRKVVHLRLRPTRNNQRAGVNWADDFALDRLAFE